jgi:hypothetical protein
MKNFILLLIPFAIICLTIWSLYALKKQAKKDWATLEELKQKANLLNTKEEIEEFHKEFLEKASKVHNQYIRYELNRIDGYLRGLYKQFTDTQKSN